MLQEWNKDPEFNALPPEEKGKILTNYFNNELADDEFRALPPERQQVIHSNFLQSEGYQPPETSLIDKGMALAGQGVDYAKGLIQTPTDQPLQIDDANMIGTPIPEGVQQSPSAIAIGEMAKDLYTGKPMPEGAGYLQKPMGALADQYNKVWTVEDEKAFRAKHPNLAAGAYALSSVILPGIGEKVYSPEERERFTKQPKAAQELELLGLTASYVAFGAAAKFGKEGLVALGKKFPILTKPIGKTILKSAWFKKLNVKMRGKTLNTAEKMNKAGMSDAEIARKLMKEQKMSGLEVEKELEAMKGIKRKTPEAGVRPQITEKAIEVKPETKPVKEKPKEKIKIPKFKGSEDAVKFGQKATPIEVKALKVLREKTLKQRDKKTKDSDEWNILNQKQALYTEAIQFGEGRKLPKDIAERLKKAEKAPVKGKEPEIEITGKEAKTVKVDIPKKEAAALNPKEQKQYLIKEIDTALKGDPLASYKFKVPGDGEFKIWGSELPEFKKRVKRIFPATLVSKKFKPAKIEQINYPNEIRKYKKILGKEPKDLKPSDLDSISGNVYNQNHFDNWLLSQNISKAVKNKILEDYGKTPKKPPVEKQQKPMASAGTPPKQPMAPKRPRLNESQRKSRERKKVIKEKQLNIESAKDAKDLLHKMIIERRQNLNLSSYDTNLFINDIEQVTSRKQRELIPFIIEKTGVPKGLKRKDLEKAYEKDLVKLTPIARQVKKHFDEGWQKIKENVPDMSAEQIENYVTHIWEVPNSKKREISNWFTTQNRFLKKRYIETINEGVEKFGLKPKVLDISEIIRIHDGVANRAIENTKFVEQLKNLKKDGVSLIERADKAPQDWVFIDHPALRKGLVIPGQAKMGEKLTPELISILDEMGVAIGRRISPVAWGKPVGKLGEYRPGENPEVRFQRFMSNRTIAHEIGHHIDQALKLGDDFLNTYKTELYAINRKRIEASKGQTGKYGVGYTSSTSEQIAEFFAHLFTKPDATYQIAPNATADALGRLKEDGVLSKLVDFDFEKSAKNLIEEQMNTMVKLPVKVHPDIAHPLKVVFDSRFDAQAIRAYEMINGILKKAQLSLSLFHHGALGETGIAIMGVGRTANIYLNPVKIYRAMVKGQYDIYKKEPIARDAIAHGLQVGATADIPVNMIQNKLNNLAAKTKNVPLANMVTGFIRTFNEAWDKALWNYMHDTLKLYAYEHLVGTKINVSKNVKKQKQEIAQFVNDTFGGQNWDILMIEPKTLQMMTWGLLSPDWTYSTVRQALSPTGFGKIHKETAGLRRKLGRHFWLKAGLYFGVGINILNHTFRKWDEKDHPEYYKGQKRKFIDRTMAGNTIGHKTHLFAGRYKDGSERYIRWGKQFRELPEMFWDDIQFSPISASLKKIGGKTAPALQAMSKITTGVSPSGFRDDDVYGKKGWDKTFGIAKSLLKSPLPFSTRSMFRENKEFHVTDLAMPSSKGMSRYKAINLFKHSILKQDERLLKEVYQQALRNNLPAYTLFKSSLTILQAENSKEFNKGIKTIEDLKKSAGKVKNMRDFMRLNNRLKRLTKENMDRKEGIALLKKAIVDMKMHEISEN